eukprot:3094719-Pyramimonas_sp.AAC.1
MRFCEPGSARVPARADADEDGAGPAGPRAGGRAAEAQQQAARRRGRHGAHLPGLRRQGARG